MKYIVFVSLFLSVAFGGVVGNTLAERKRLQNEIRLSHPEIVVTELLLQEYLSDCNKPGYRRFSTFHQHNIDNGLRKVAHAGGFPDFLSARFLTEMRALFSAHQQHHRQLKQQFKDVCGEV